MSYGHCRLTEHSGGIEEIVRRSVSQFGEDEEKMKFIYSKTDLVPKLLSEINVEFEKRSFGIIPTCKMRGGHKILKELQKHLPSILTNTELTTFTKIDKGFRIELEQSGNTFVLMCKNLILATGGYAGTYKYNDNVTYKNYNIFNLVKDNGGQIINTSCVFTHPFGYDKGRKVLTGNISKTGKFIDGNGEYVFNKKIRNLILNDNYHEVFDQIIDQTEQCRQKGSSVYFISQNGKELIVPCTHYTSGGIKTDYIGRILEIPGLFAIGECQANGSKNNGRFPGYPFTSSIIYGKELANLLK